MAHNELHDIARALVADGKGILAADESTGTIKKRFDSIGVENTEDEPARLPRPALHDARRRGVHQRRHPLRRDDPPERARRHAVPEAARVEGRHPGDQGRPGREAPRARRGRDDHRRASTACASGSPSTTASARASRSGARRTRSATSCRASTASGRTRTRSPATPRSARRRASSRSSSRRSSRTARTRSSGATTSPCKVLAALYTELSDQRVDLAGTLLKPNMVLSGYEASNRAGVDEVAEWTLKCYYKHVPAAVPGIVFLSGGQSDEDCDRAPQCDERERARTRGSSRSRTAARCRRPPLKAWSGKPEQVEAGQRAYYHRAKLNSAATHRRLRAGDGARDRERLRRDEGGAARRPLYERGTSGIRSP